MMMIRFAHVSDTHLGASNFKLDEREEDFLKVFEEFVDKCLDRNVDFVVHSGDLFDTPKPKNKILVFTVEQLRRLERAGIPFFTLPGSHDVSVEGTFLTVLEKVGLVTNLGNPRYFEQQGGEIVLKGEVYDRAFLAGMPGRRAGIKEVYRRLKTGFEDSELKIFVFHHTVSDANAFFSDISTSLLPKGFDYYAGGHWHKRFETEYDDSPLNYPGPLENCDVKEMSYQQDKGFYIVTFEGGDISCELEKVSARRIVWEEINCDGMTPEQIEKKVFEKMGGPSDEPLLIIKLKGRLGEGRRSEINRSEIIKRAHKKGYLHAHTSISDLSNPVTDLTVSVMDKSVENIEGEYLKKKGFEGKELDTAKKIIRVLGKEMTPSQTQSAQKNVVQSIEEEFNV